MRDAAALAVGVSYIPILTLASTILALGSSVPVGWLFEAPNPERRGRSWRGRIGLTRGETQGTSLALFYRCFAICLVGYAIGFKLVELLRLEEQQTHHDQDHDLTNIILHKNNVHEQYHHLKLDEDNNNNNMQCTFANLDHHDCHQTNNIFYAIFYLKSYLASITNLLSILLTKFGKFFYIAFFLVVHLMKLHSLSLIWGVASEAMEYEEQAEKRERKRYTEINFKQSKATEPKNCPNLIYSQQQTLHQHHPQNTEITSDDANDNYASRTPSSTPDKTGKGTRARLKKLAFVGFGGTLGGILGSVFVSVTAHTLRLSGLLIVAAILLELSAELSIELGQIMLRHWHEEQWERNSNCDLNSLSNGAVTEVPTKITDGSNLQQSHKSALDSSLRRTSSIGSMKRIASGNTINNTNASSTLTELDISMKKTTSMGSMKRVASGASLQRVRSSLISLNTIENDNIKRNKSGSSLSSTSGDSKGDKIDEGLSKHNGNRDVPKENNNLEDQPHQTDQLDDNSFKQRLLRGITTILRSRLLMTIFTYNALYATTSVLLSFQRAELVANRGKSSSVNGSGKNVDLDAAFLAKINIASSVAVFALQASGMGAFIATYCGQRGTLSLMPLVRMVSVALLAWWHVKGDGKPPNLLFFLVLDEFTKVTNFAIAKPVRESLWRGLSNEARYEAKPIVDTLANRWGGGSAAFLMSALDRIMHATGLGIVADDGNKTLFGFPPILILCAVSSVW
eukprot:CAMPEP_0184873768 /NCGR_PEP_ID=MMETSP0580-20130426/42021_1 /TAXON_ID=1118495 /ORGANISM="Dactyliosolen fragilissimus" /LENGTH=738 /DNA_ID=CAMNT_0027376705 /DNA_START=1242 /DNA_END=3455 /DNA_ORIENTATION=-